MVYQGDVLQIRKGEEKHLNGETVRDTSGFIGVRPRPS